MAKQQKDPDGIRILSVVWYKVLPPLFGGQKGVALFNEYLGRLAPLTCLCSENNIAIPGSYGLDASLPVSKTQFFNPLCWWKIYAAVKRTKATHLILEFPYYGLAGVLCKRLLDVKLLVHAHNIESLRFKEQGKWWWRPLQAYEKWTLQKADTVFFKTEKEKAFAIKQFAVDPEKTMVVPYGIEVREKPDKAKAKAIILERHAIKPDTRLLLFAGTLDYSPNAAAISELKTNVIPLLNKTGLSYKILVCGRVVDKAFSYLQNMSEANLLYAGNVEDIDTYFAAADVFLNPVAAGGGVQTKIVDALAFYLNVVCFEGRQEGIEGAVTKIFTAQKGNWTAFTDAISQALESRKPTPPDFFKQHDWNNIAAKAFNFIRSI
jgi:polysaccharide biosynthesis protein PslH